MDSAEGVDGTHLVEWLLSMQVLEEEAGNHKFKVILIYIVRAQDIRPCILPPKKLVLAIYSSRINGRGYPILV